MIFREFWRFVWLIVYCLLDLAQCWSELGAGQTGRQTTDRQDTHTRRETRETDKQTD
jgi:hypothetical protein